MKKNSPGGTQPPLPSVDARSATTYALSAARFTAWQFGIAPFAKPMYLTRSTTPNERPSMDRHQKNQLDRLEQFAISWGNQKPFKNIDREATYVSHVQLPLKPGVMDNLPTEEAAHAAFDEIEQAALRFQVVNNTGLDLLGRGYEIKRVRDHKTGAAYTALVVHIFIGRPFTDDEKEVNDALKALDLQPGDEPPTYDEMVSQLKAALPPAKFEKVMSVLFQGGVTKDVYDTPKEEAEARPSETFQKRDGENPHAPLIHMPPRPKLPPDVKG